jgi:hypothetical protein
MSETAASFGSNMISGLLRSAPDLMQNIKHVRSMYKVAEGILVTERLSTDANVYGKMMTSYIQSLAKTKITTRS